MNKDESNPKRFAVALSFPGQHRQFVLNVAKRLAEELGRERVFYDEWYEAELLGLDGDLKLKRFYRDQSEFLVPFFSEHYRKPWCKVEWHSIRSMLLNRRDEDAVVPVHMDGTVIEGWEAVDFGIRRKGRTGKQIADLILKSYRQRQAAAQQSADQRSAAKPARRTAAGRPQNLPFATLGSLFKGRDSFLVQLHDMLSGGAGGAAAITTKAHALHGMGGVGKTRTAIEYAWRYQDDYRALLFVPAETPQKLAASLASLTGVLGLEELEESPDDARRAAVLGWLGKNPGWLAILDNVDTAEAAAAVRDNLARLTSGHVLITSRISQWSGSVRKLDLDVLDPDSAADYVLEATAADRRPADDDAEVARQVAEQVGRLALGLEHAAAYINNHGYRLQEYLDQWRDNAEAILAEFDLQQIDYPREILVTWKLSADRLSADARGLLDLLCWFAPDPIPESLLGETPHDFPIANAREALNELVRYWLARREQDEPLFTLHRLVQATTRHHLRRPHDASEAGDRPAIAAVLRWIDGAFTGDANDVRTWPRLDPLSPHAVSLCDHAEQAGLASVDYPTSRLLNQVGLLLKTKARHAEAEPLYRRALAIDEQSYGAEHPRVAIDLNNLAVLLKATNRLAEAEPLMRRALAIDEQSYGAEHPRVAIDLNNLAALLQDTNRLADAEPLMRLTLEIDEQSYGAEHPYVARDLNNLAGLLKVTNRLAEAEPLIVRAQEINEKALGADHPAVAPNLAWLAEIMKATNRLAEAEPLMRRALAIDEQSYGAEHPKVARDLNNLAGLLQATNRLAEAEPMLRRAAEICEASLGPDHPNTQTAAENHRLLLAAIKKGE